MTIEQNFCFVEKPARAPHGAIRQHPAAHSQGVHTMTVGNLLANLPLDHNRETFDALLESGAFRLERIVSYGQSTPPGQWYDQPTQEWVLLLRGRAALLIAGEPRPRELGPGDHVLLPTGCRHRVEWTHPHEPTVWLALHFA